MAWWKNVLGEAWQHGRRASLIPLVYTPLDRKTDEGTKIKAFLQNCTLKLLTETLVHFFKDVEGMIDQDLVE